MAPIPSANHYQQRPRKIKVRIKFERFSSPSTGPTESPKEKLIRFRGKRRYRQNYFHVANRFQQSRQARPSTKRTQQTRAIHGRHIVGDALLLLRLARPICQKPPFPRDTQVWAYEREAAADSGKQFCVASPRFLDHRKLREPARHETHVDQLNHLRRHESPRDLDLIEIFYEFSSRHRHSPEFDMLPSSPPHDFRKIRNLTWRVSSFLGLWPV